MSASNARTYFLKTNDKRGSMLLVTYMVITVLLILGAAFLVRSSNESRSSEAQRKITQAFYNAEAGLERAIYDLRQDFINAVGTPSWSDGNINGMLIGPNTGAYYNVPYAATALNGGTYAVSLRNVSNTNDIWIRSTGTVDGIRQTIEAYVRMYSLSPWGNAIFGGAGASGAMVNGNVNISGSVHILGTGLSSGDYAIDLGGTAELVRNNYIGLAAGLKAKVPALPTTVFNGETVETINAELRVKKGKVGLSGSSTVGEPNVAGNAFKETVDGAYVTDGYGGTKGTANVYSDNGTSNDYDLGDSMSFPSLNDSYKDGLIQYNTYREYLKANALVITDPAKLAVLANITPGSSFNYSDLKGSISMNGSGAMTISGIVYLGDDITAASLNMSAAGAAKTITYTGTGSVLVTGSAQINVNLVTSGDNSYPTNILGVMTPNTIGFNEANIDVMGLFYAETKIKVEKQTDLIGTIVTNYFDLGTNVPSVYQVPATSSNLPPGMIAGTAGWLAKVLFWSKINNP